MARNVWILGSFLAVLLAADFALDRTERARRARDPAIERLVSQERTFGEKVAAFSVEEPGRSLLYVRTKGLWRCREAFGAVCDEAAVRELRLCFFDARGVERAQGRADERMWGFGEGDTLAIAFHGPKLLDAPGRDVLIAFEVGRSFAEGRRGRAFVREKGSSRVLEIDRDPRRVLGSDAGRSLPPLVDTRLLAGCLPGGFRGFREFRVETAQGESLRVAIDEVGGEGAGEPAEWFLDRGRGRERLLPYRVGGYIGLWLRGRFGEVVSPARAKELGLDPPAATVHIAPEGPEGNAPIELAISAVDGQRRAYAWNKTTNVVAVVPAEWQPLLAPGADMFTDTSRPNPWEAWLRRP